MKHLKWDETLSVQVDEVDEDHRRLLDLFNILSSAIEQDDDAAYIEAVLDELLSCTIWHFCHEERLMLKNNFEGLAEHKAEHQELTQSATTLKHKFLNQGKTLSLADFDYLERWLTGHILSADMEMGRYLSEVM